MYALKQKHKDGLVLVRVDGHLCDIHGEIKWFRHYLEAEEYCQKVSYDVEAIEASEILKFALNLCKVKEARIKQLLNEVIELQQTINPDLVKYHPDNFNHMHSVDSLEGIKPEHSYEEDPT